MGFGKIGAPLADARAQGCEARTWAPAGATRAAHSTSSKPSFVALIFQKMTGAEVSSVTGS